MRDVLFIRRQLEMLKLEHPEIWENDDDRLLAIESETELPELLARIVRRMLETAGHAKGLALVVDQFRDRKERLDARADALRKLIFDIMQQADLRKIELPVATLTVKPGPQKVIITDEAAVPEQYIRTKREPDKVSIKDSILHGITVPGAVLSNSAESLNVRIK